MQPDVILLVEDNPDDVALMKRAFEAMALGYRLVHVGDGREAIEYLMGMGPYADRTVFPLPRMILLDLQMPNLDGFQFLEWLRKEPAVCRMPVVVLATSHYSGDVKRAYNVGADSFVTKPMERESLVEELKLALLYWAPIGGEARDTSFGERAGRGGGDPG